jgi:polyferredoxin
MLHKLKLITWRRFSQIGIGIFLTNGYFRVFFTKITYAGFWRGACVPFLNCHACPTAIFSCPIGMLQHFMAIQSFPYFLLGFFMVVGLVVGRAACGWLCPFGLIQDWLYKIKTKKFGIPQFLNYAKYLVLIGLVIIIPYLTAEHWFSKLCPFGALIAGIPWVAWNPVDPDFDAPVIDTDLIGPMYYLKILILIAFLLWFIFAKRPFCRTICPMGAIWALFNRISLLKATVKESCVECHQCATVCPMELDVYKEVNSENCIKCLDCTTCKHVQSEFQL